MSRHFDGESSANGIIVDMWMQWTQWPACSAPCRLVFTAIVVILMVMVGHPSAATEQDADQEARMAQLRERLEETRARLNLTDDQIEQMTPILRSGFEAQATVLRKYGIDLKNRSDTHERLRLRQLRRLGRDLDAVRQQTLKKLDDVLTGAQIEEYKKIQKERKQALRKRLRQRRR